MAYGVYRRPAWLFVTHLFNHQTHHRGQVTALLAAGAVGPLGSGFGKLCPPVIGAAQVDQQRLGAQAQLFHIHARRHSKEHVAQLCALALGVRCRVRLVVAAASFL